MDPQESAETSGIARPLQAVEGYLTVLPMPVCQLGRGSVVQPPPLCSAVSDCHSPPGPTSSSVPPTATAYWL